jgi:hypothetical protein
MSWRRRDGRGTFRSMRPLLVATALALCFGGCGGSDTKLKVTGIDPEKGDAAGGTYVKIYGNAFTTPDARGAKIYFGSRKGTVVRFASDRELVVEAPSGTPNQTVDVLVIFEPGGELKIPKAFTFVEKTAPNIDVPKPAPGEKK